MDTNTPPPIPQPKAISFSLTPALILNAVMVPVTLVAFLLDMGIAMSLNDHWAKDAIEEMSKSDSARPPAVTALILLFALIALIVWCTAWVGMAKKTSWARRVGWAAWVIQIVSELAGGFSIVGPFSSTCITLLTASFAVAWSQSKR